MRIGAAPAASGADLNRLAVSASNHCLTGCAMGELTGMLIAYMVARGRGHALLHEHHGREHHVTAREPKCCS